MIKKTKKWNNGLSLDKDSVGDIMYISSDYFASGPFSIDNFFEENVIGHSDIEYTCLILDEEVENFEEAASGIKKMKRITNPNDRVFKTFYNDTYRIHYTTDLDAFLVLKQKYDLLMEFLTLTPRSNLNFNGYKDFDEFFNSITGDIMKSGDNGWDEVEKGDLWEKHVNNAKYTIYKKYSVVPAKLYGASIIIGGKTFKCESLMESPGDFMELFDKSK